jgi:hypothetical protein
MNKQQIHRAIGKIVVGLSFAALLAVLSGYAQPPQPDEGTAAHIFQFSIVGLLPMLPAYLMTRIGSSLGAVCGSWRFQALL